MQISPAGGSKPTCKGISQVHLWVLDSAGAPEFVAKHGFMNMEVANTISYNIPPVHQGESKDELGSLPVG